MLENGIGYIVWISIIGNFMSENEIVPKVWNYCDVLWDDGVSYGDYVEHLK